MLIDPGHTEITIVGLGNVLLKDDGVGVHAVRELQKDPPKNVVVAEIGTRALAAQQLLEDADLVIAIDAAHADGPPGSIYRFDADNLETDRPHSLHDLGIIGLLGIMPEESRPKVIILGVEPEVIDYGMELSPTVQAVLGRVVQATRQIVEEVRAIGLANLNAASLCAQDNT